MQRILGSDGDERAGSYSALRRAFLSDGRDGRLVEFFVADVESDDLGGPYDAAFARCGTMFFTFPGRAMKNIRKSLKPGGKFTQIVWRKREDNAWLHDAELITKEVDAPTIGIGAGARVDGQVLVFHDVVGLGGERVPKFVRRYADLHGTAVDAVRRFFEDVQKGEFPADDETYHMPDEVARALLSDD